MHYKCLFVLVSVCEYVISESMTVETVLGLCCLLEVDCIFFNITTVNYDNIVRCLVSCSYYLHSP